MAKVFTDANYVTTPDDVRKSMGSRIAEHENLVAVVEGKVVANVEMFCLDLIVDGIPLRTGGIAGVSTRWDYRRRGLATALMGAAIKRIKAKGISNATLFTGVNLPAMRIYERLGYSETSRWLRFCDVRKPFVMLTQAFKRRSAWLPKTPFGRAILEGWRERVLYESDGWRATVTYNGKRFILQRGGRGKPTIVMRGPTFRLVECFRNKLAYDRFVKDGTIEIAGKPRSLATWRRLVTLEWVE